MFFGVASLNLTFSWIGTSLPDPFPFSEETTEKCLARANSLFKRDFGTPKTSAVSSAEADRASIRALILLNIITEVLAVVVPEFWG